MVVIMLAVGHYWWRLNGWRCVNKIPASLREIVKRDPFSPAFSWLRFLMQILNVIKQGEFSDTNVHSASIHDKMGWFVDPIPCCFELICRSNLFSRVNNNPLFLLCRTIPDRRREMSSWTSECRCPWFITLNSDIYPWSTLFPPEGRGSLSRKRNKRQRATEGNVGSCM